MAFTERPVRAGLVIAAMFAGLPVFADEAALRLAGSLVVTADAETAVYHAVEVQQPDGGLFRSSNYIESPTQDAYAIAISGYLDPKPAADLAKLIPMQKGPLITVHLRLDAQGRQEQPAQIIWEIDPAGGYGWESVASPDGVVAQVETVNLSPEGGHIKARFSGTLCRVSYPAVQVDVDDCRPVSVQVDSELSRLY